MGLHQGYLLKFIRLYCTQSNIPQPKMNMLSKTYRAVRWIQRLISNFIFPPITPISQSNSWVVSCGIARTLQSKKIMKTNKMFNSEFIFGFGEQCFFPIFYLIVFSNLFLDFECSFPEHLHVRQCTILVKSRSFASLLSCSSWEPRPLLAFAKVEG